MSVLKEMYNKGGDSGEKAEERVRAYGDSLDDITLKDLIMLTAAGRRRSGVADYLLLYFIMKKVEAEERRRTEESVARAVRESLLREFREEMARESKVEELVTKLGDTIMTIGKSFFTSRAASRSGSVQMPRLNVEEAGGVREGG